MKWEQVEFHRVTPDGPAVDAMLTALRNTNCILDDDRSVVTTADVTIQLNPLP